MKNTKVQSVFIEKFPVRTARFTVDGAEVGGGGVYIAGGSGCETAYASVCVQIIAASRRPHFHVLDVASGAVHRVSGIQGVVRCSLLCRFMECFAVVCSALLCSSWLC